MSRLLSKKQAPDGFFRTQHITPQKANWTYVGFDALQLKTGQSTMLQAKESSEICVVLISGMAEVTIDNTGFGTIGQRLSPFEKTKPYAIYLSPDSRCQLIAKTDLELGVGYSPSQGKSKSRLITPDDIGAEHRGKGQNKRLVHNILPDTADADGLLVVEVFTDQGCSSSYPSHKHDTLVPPDETQLEETYYHRLHPAQGFCFQRVYTEDRELDESMAVYDGDLVMVPRGYHPVATVAGYDSYYLNIMSGPVRKWLFTWEKDHEWINGPDYS